MDVIKFRTWDKKNKILYSWEDMQLWGNPTSVPLVSIAEAILSDRYVTMLFTGNRDKTGEEIYFEDIVEGIDGLGCPFSGPVWFKKEWGRIYIAPNLTLTANIALKSKIIGNTFENTDLRNDILSRMP